MNRWPFVIIAYAIALAATGWLLLSSFLSMRRAEDDAGKLRGDER